MQIARNVTFWDNFAEEATDFPFSLVKINVGF
jgi:hypothetical protein